MADALKKVKPGDPLVIPAEAYNAFIDTAQAFRCGQINLTGPATSTGGNTGVILVGNASGSDHGRFAILGIQGVVINPSDNLPEFQSRIALTVGLPTDGDPFVVLQEPIANGSIGLAMAAGVTVVQLNVIDAAHGYAKAETDPASLTTDTEGNARILWKESGTGLKWAVVQFPVSIAGPGLVILKYDGARTGKRYTGHLWTSAGQQGDACQFRFPNDPGVESLLGAGEYVLARSCPEWDEANAAWSGTDAKYWAVLSPWAAMS